MADHVEADGWGIGFYQGGEVLLRRRPKRPERPVDFYELASEVQTDLLIGHVRTATVGVAKNENTHPFRFRSWLFAHHGTVQHFDGVREQLLSSVPDFLLRNLRGQTDSEHIFHLFLSFLHDGGKLDDPLISASVAAQALASTFALVRRLADRADEPASELDVALTNGRILLVARRGAPVHLYRVSGVRDCPVCREHPGSRDARDASESFNHEHLRGVVLVAGNASAAAPWEEVPDNHLVLVSHDLTVSIQPLESYV